MEFAALSVELIGGTADLKTPVGLLDFDLEILPTPSPLSFTAATGAAEGAVASSASSASTSSSSSAAPGKDKEQQHDPLLLPVFIPQALVVKQINRERVVTTETEQRFRAYAKTWWRDYQSMRAAHEGRSVTMFAMAEDGTRRFVSTFVAPLAAGRCLDSALHAARFVRLIPFEKEVKIGGERSGIWATPHTFLSLGKGDIENHVLLLCSLLLGFGLDAYVCVGTNARGPHMWVLTRGADASTASSSSSSAAESQRHGVCFWESLTGRRIPIGGAAADALAAHYTTIGCVFNHRRFYANAQADDAVGACDFAFENERQWKGMSADAIGMLEPLPSAPLAWPQQRAADGGSTAEDEERLERELRALIAEKRGDRASTTFDDQFGYILSPSLGAYECERVTGVAYGNDEFQQAVKLHIPVGHVFKGFPIHFGTRDAARVMAALMQHAACVDIVETRGDAVRFGLRVKIFPYPEGVCAVWLMLAVKYRPTEADAAAP